jgi:ABC-type branched-subunit amino acid transport system ATPase component
MSALACAEIRKTYGAFVALDGVGIGVGQGEVLGLAGPNGAGKTTLFDILSGRTRPDAGTVTLGEQDITSQSATARSRHGIARTYQAPLVPTMLTVGETLQAARDAFAPHPTAEAMDAARELVGLRAMNAALAGGLDTLERRKLLLTCLLMREPTVLLMDEPCSGLLQDEIDDIDAVIRRVVAERKCAVIVVEHRLELLRAIAESVVVMDAGAVIAEGPPAAVFDDPAVRAAYFEAPKAA